MHKVKYFDAVKYRRGQCDAGLHLDCLSSAHTISLSDIGISIPGMKLLQILKINLSNKVKFVIKKLFEFHSKLKPKRIIDTMEKELI